MNVQRYCGYYVSDYIYLYPHYGLGGKKTFYVIQIICVKHADPITLFIYVTSKNSTSCSMAQRAANRLFVNNACTIKLKCSRFQILWK